MTAARGLHYRVDKDRLRNEKTRLCEQARDHRARGCEPQTAEEKETGQHSIIFIFLKVLCGIYEKKKEKKKRI